MFTQDLAELELFRHLKPEQLDLIAPLLEPRFLQTNEVIFEQGAAARFLYILCSGRVLVQHKPYDGPPIVIARVDKGGVFGWSAALRHVVYTSSAQCEQRGEAYRLEGRMFQKFCEEQPETGVILLEGLAGVIAQRLVDHQTQLFNLLTKDIYGMKEPRVEAKR